MMCLSLSIILSFISSVQYESIDNVSPLFNQFGRNAVRPEAYINDAFCIIPIHPDDYKLFGFSW